jgi:hypothetical protein
VAKDDPKSGTTDKSGAGKPSRRPPPTLDLSAKDVTKPTDPAPVTPVSDEAATTEPLASAEAAAETPKTPTPNTSGEVPVLDAEAPATAGAGGSDEPPMGSAQAPEPDPVPPAAKRPARQLGLIGGLAVALVSGVLGAAVAFAIVGTFTSAEENADAITELEARALDLRQRVETLEAAGGEPAAGQPPAGLDTAPAELAARLDALESGLDALGKKVDTQPAPVAPTEAAPATPGASAEAVAALGSRVGAVEDKLSSLPAPAPAATPDDVAAATARIGALESKVAALPAPSVSPDDLAAATSRIAALEQKLSAVASTQQASGQGAAQLVALSALREAVLGSKPFTAELKAALALLGAEAAPLAALEPVAAEGFPAGPALAAELKRAVAPPPAPPTQAGVPTDEGMLDRLMRGAQGLVTVRRLDATGTSPGIGEAQAALERGDFAAARAALATLPEADRAKVQPVAQILEARQAALDAIAGLNQHVLASLAGGAQ